MNLPTGWTACVSNAIAAFRYLPDDQVLQIAFVEGRHVYDYPCNQQLFRDFQAAPSKGRFVNNVLGPHARRLGWSRPRYPWPW